MEDQQLTVLLSTASRSPNKPASCRKQSRPSNLDWRPPLAPPTYHLPHRVQRDEVHLAVIANFYLERIVAISKFLLDDAFEILRI